MHSKKGFAASPFSKFLLAVVLLVFILGVLTLASGPTALITQQGKKVHANAGPDKVVTLGNPMALNGSDSYAEEGHKVIRYDWRLISPVLRGPKEFSGAVYRYTPEKAGDYTAQLTVITDKNARDIDTAFVTVRERGPTDDPRAIFVRAANRFCEPSKECTIGWTATVKQGVIKQYTLDFGDGTTESEEINARSITTTTTHTYGKEGVYTFKVTVTSSTKDLAEATATIRV